MIHPPERIRMNRMIGFQAEIKSLPAQRVAYTRHTAKSFSAKELTLLIKRGLDDLYAALNGCGVAVGAVGMAIYETKGSEIEVITAYPVAPEIKSGDGYEVMELPEAAYAAVAVHRGSLKNVSKTWRALRCWIEQQGRKPGVQYREIYILGGHNPEPLWITELQQSIPTEKPGKNRLTDR